MFKKPRFVKSTNFIDIFLGNKIIFFNKQIQTLLFRAVNSMH